MASFKTSANFFDPRLPPERPLMGSSCNRCTTLKPRTKTENDVSLSALGLANLLQAPIHNRNQNILTRYFSYASYVLSRRVDSHFPDVCHKVIRCDRVRQAIREAAEEEFHKIEDEESELIDPKELRVLEQKHRSRAVDILQRMKSCISGSLLRIAGWVLYRLLSRIFTSIQFHKGQIERLRRCRTSANIPIIYLPLHRSHLDYILVSFILYMNNIKPPLVAAGDNLLIPLFGNLMRGLGAFFIKRRLDYKDGKKDTVYKAILHSYMTENLREGNSLEFFIEGGRSRTGKSLQPKCGLLSVVVDSVLEGIVDDAFIVPVAISYEKLIDGSFVGEQLGKPKQSESFGVAARAIWSTLHSKFGSVRVDFCQPFSLKDYLHTAAYTIYNNNLQIDKFPETNHKDCSNACVACSGLRRDSSFQSIYGLDIVVSEEKRQTIEKLAEHVVYDSSNAVPLMSTQMVAFLLLTKHRNGVNIHQLARSLDWMRDECSRRCRDIALTGDSLDAIQKACQLLGKDVIAVEKLKVSCASPNPAGTVSEKNVQMVFLKASVKLPQVLELQYYANACLSVFQLDSIVVNALFAILNTELNAMIACGDDMESKITINFYELLEKSVELCEILKNDFFFTPPCTKLRDILSNKIEDMILFGVLCDTKKDTTDYNLRYKYRHYEFDEDEDDGYIGQRNSFSAPKRDLRIPLTEENLDMIRFYRSVLASYIESYWVAASTLSTLIGAEPKEEKSFFNGIIEVAKEKQQKGLLFHEECIAAEPFKNAVKLFESWNVLNITTDKFGVRKIGLNPEFNSIEAIDRVILRIEEFKK